MSHNPASIRRRGPAQVIFAGAATVAILGLFGAASPGSAEGHVASSAGGGTVVAVDDDSSSAPDDTGGGVNDQGQSSGDVFIQNAQDQSTA